MDYGHDDVIVIDHDDERIIIIDKDGGCIKHARCKIFSLINQCFLVCCTVCLHSKSVEADDDNASMLLWISLSISFQLTRLILVLFNSM